MCDADNPPDNHRNHHLYIHKRGKGGTEVQTHNIMELHNPHHWCIPLPRVLCHADASFLRSGYPLALLIFLCNYIAILHENEQPGVVDCRVCVTVCSWRREERLSMPGLRRKHYGRNVCCRSSFPLLIFCTICGVIEQKN